MYSSCLGQNPQAYRFVIISWLTLICAKNNALEFKILSCCRMLAIQYNRLICILFNIIVLWYLDIIMDRKFNNAIMVIDDTWIVFWSMVLKSNFTAFILEKIMRIDIFIGDKDHSKIAIYIGVILWYLRFLGSKGADSSSKKPPKTKKTKKKKNITGKTFKNFCSTVVFV